MSEDERLLGFLRPQWPLNGLRPTQEATSFFELFANQAAVAIEGARLSNELRAAVRQITEAEQIKKSFLLTASHELRTPLTAIQGYLELLGEYGETLDESSRMRFIQNALRGCDELVLLLGNVLDATYLDAEKITVKAAPVSLSRSVQAILEILEPTIVREKRQIEVQVAPDLQVIADELRLRQILLNLLGNALKYTPPGSPIALSTESVDRDYLGKYFVGERRVQGSGTTLSGTFIVLTVRDWGPGVSQAEQPLLFTRFARLEAATKSSQQGAGLGLYLCRRLVEAMGGWIWMESSGRDGEGVCFFVALPSEKT
jgi:signal transduction histidine kinase